MIEQIIYRYKRKDGGITISPEKPMDVEYTEKKRLIAEENCVITDGEKKFNCIDVDFNEVSNYYEMNVAEEENV